MGICRRCARVFPAVFYAGEQQGAHNFLLKCSNKSFFTFFGLKLGRKFSYLLWHHSSIRLTIRVLTMGNFLLSIFCPAKIMKVSERIKISCIRVVLQKKSSKWFIKVIDKFHWPIDFPTLSSELDNTDQNLIKRVRTTLFRRSNPSKTLLLWAYKGKSHEPQQGWNFLTEPNRFGQADYKISIKKCLTNSILIFIHIYNYNSHNSTYLYTFY